MHSKIAVLVLSLLLFGAQQLAAQATRTWVSGVGDDVNPCSRTAPCKTFAGAISKTAAGGEISVLDPGGYGTLTITKSITIDGRGFVSSALNAGGTSGFTINADSAEVTLRNLQINGAATGLNGVRILAAANVMIENANIQGFTRYGIEDLRTTGGSLTVRNTVIENGIGANSYGVVVEPAAVTTNILRMDGVSISGMGATGVYLANGVKAVITNSTLHANGFDGVTVNNGAELNLENSVVLRSSANGVRTTGNAILRISDTTIVGNIVNGTLIGAGSQIVTYGRNRINGNGGSNGAGMVVLTEQ